MERCDCLCLRSSALQHCQKPLCIPVVVHEISTVQSSRNRLLTSDVEPPGVCCCCVGPLLDWTTVLQMLAWMELMLPSRTVGTVAIMQRQWVLWCLSCYVQGAERYGSGCQHPMIKIYDLFECLYVYKSQQTRAIAYLISKVKWKKLIFVT